MGETYSLYLGVGQCLLEDGRIREAVPLFEESYQWTKNELAETHPARLTSQHELASAYEANGQVKEAIALLEQVVAIEATTLAETHPRRLASKDTLAYFLQQA